MGELFYPSAGAATAAPARVDVREGVAPFALGALGVLGLGAAHGGYFATSWGWCVLALAAVLVWSLSVRTIGRPTVTEAALVGGLLLLCVWYALSTVWGNGASSIDESARALVYAAGAAAAFSLVRRGSAATLFAGALTGASGIAVYALATRLFPDRIGMFDSIAVYRLSTPIGYWNALGLLCAIALLLDPRRLRLTATALVVGGPAAIGVFVGSRSAALTHLHAAAARAAHDGHRLALLIVVLVLVSAALGAAMTVLRGRLSLPAHASRVYAIVLV